MSPPTQKTHKHQVIHENPWIFQANFSEDKHQNPSNKRGINHANLDQNASFFAKFPSFEIIDSGKPKPYLQRTGGNHREPFARKPKLLCKTNSFRFMAFLLVGEEKFPIDLWKPQVDTPSMKGPSEKTKKTNPPKKK